MVPGFDTLAHLMPLRWNFLRGLFGWALLVCGGSAVAATNSTHWAFQPLTQATAADGKHPDSVDRLVFGAPARKGRQLLRAADRRTLIRRLSFDLRGLPPSPDEVAAFLKDKRPDAYERFVESFLASPRYGERWGRHWLDIVAYADSNGYFSADSDRPLAWKFRDYVVRSINADKPLDQFIREQIAGDELVGYVAGGDVTPEMVDPLIATHFWRNAPDGTGESDGNPLEVKVDKYAVLEGSVQVLGSAFLGLTVQCARCHDHKFEPVTQEEYYGLQAILRPAFDVDHWLKPNERVIEVGTRAERAAHKRRVTEVERDLKTLKESLEGLTAPFRKQALDENLALLDEPLRKAIQKAFDTKEKERDAAMKALLKTNATLVDVGAEALQKRFPAFAAAATPIEQAIKAKQSEKPPPLEQIAATFEPTNPPPAHHLLVRGNHAKEGQEIGAGTPGILGSPKSKVQSPKSSGGSGSALMGSSKFSSSGRRLALGEWLTAPENPIVARVLVNRVWHYHFGEGLVRTIDNFGRSGSRPVHPELLDWLANELIRSGWSLKHLHRLILNSAMWKQACGEPVFSGSVFSNSVFSGAANSGPLNTGLLNTDALTFSQPRRLDAESLRDTMLAVSGELDLHPGGPYVATKTDKQGQVIIDEKQPGALKRSIYLQQRRTAPVSVISTFDGPAHNPVCVQRVSSTVALQSLSLLNSDFVRTRARAFAKRVLAISSPSPLKGERAGVRGEAVRLASTPTVIGRGGEGAGAAKAKKKLADAALQLAFELAYSRPPTADELSAARNFLHEQEMAYPEKSDATEQIWTDLCQMLLASNAFLYVD